MEAPSNSVGLRIVPQGRGGMRVLRGASADGTFSPAAKMEPRRGQAAAQMPPRRDQTAPKGSQNVAILWPEM